MDDNLRLALQESDFEDDTLTPRVIDELPKLQRRDDDPTYIDWLNNILRKINRTRQDAVPTEMASRAMGVS